MMIRQENRTDKYPLVSLNISEFVPLSSVRAISFLHSDQQTGQLQTGFHEYEVHLPDL